MKKIDTYIIGFFKKITGGSGHAALMQWSLVALLLVLPILVLPSLVDNHAPIKQAALVILTTLAFLGWTLTVYREQSWQRRKGLMIWMPVVVLIGVVVSAVLSTSGYAAWIGSGGQGFTAVMPFFAMVLLYIMVMHVSENSSSLRRLTFAGMLGVFSAQIYSLCGILGLSTASAAAIRSGSTLVGTFESLGILGVVMTLFAVGIWIVADNSKTDTWMPNRFWQVAFLTLGSLITLTTLSILIIGDRWPMEVVMLVGSGMIVALGLHDPRKFVSPKRMLAPMFLFSVSLLLLMFNVSLGSAIPVEISPSYSAGWEIGVDTLRSDGVFGSGPGTWLSDFTRFKPESFNDGQFWQVSFDHANSHMLTLMSTWGVVPTVLLFLFYLWVIVTAIDALMLKRAREGWQTIAVLFGVWSAILVSRFVYSADIVLDVFFWLITGILVANITPRMHSISFKTHGRASLLTSMSIVVAGIAFILSSVISVQWLMGEVTIARAVEVQNNEGTPEDVVNIIGNAVRLNSWHSGYARALAIAHFKRVDVLALDVEANSELIVQGSQFAVVMAEQAIALEPLDVRGYNLLGIIYENLSTVIGGSEILALDQYRIAVALDPVNPQRHVKLARALILVSDNAYLRIDEDALREQTVDTLLLEAEEVIDEATRLKPNYAPAFYARTLVLERQGKLQDAINQMIPLIKISPQDPILRFELGILLMRAGDKNAALQSFQVATSLSPTYANAKWYMVALYEDAGELDLAILELEDLSILNPDDTNVVNKLNLLRQGKASEQAAEDTVPLEEADAI